MRFLIVNFLFLIMVLLLSCWEKQKHEITAPIVPNYTLSGLIRDTDSHELLAGCEVKIYPQSLIYADVEMIQLVDTCDVSGYYQIDSVTPGTYFVYVKRGSYKVKEAIIMVEHQDKLFDVSIPKALMSHSIYMKGSAYGTRDYPKFNGICWINQSMLAGIWGWKDYSDDPLRWRVVNGNYSMGFTIIGEKKLSNENPMMWGLTYLNTYLACGNKKIVSIHPGMGHIQSELQIAYAPLDITNDGKTIWITSSNRKVIQLNSNASQIIQIYDIPTEIPGGIAWDGKNLWSGDLQENLIYKHDHDFKVNLTFCPIYEDHEKNYSTIYDIKFLSFNKLDQTLWAGDGQDVYQLESSDYVGDE